MVEMNIDELYGQYIRPLAPKDRLRLLAMMAQDLARQQGERGEAPKHSIMELHGLGKEIWQGVDAQEYVDELRKEWDLL